MPAEVRLGAVDRELLAGQVAGRLRSAILQGVLAPGQRLPEVELARQLGVSRAPLREALRALEQEGLVESLPNRGCSVILLTAADVAEIFSLRRAVESLAVRLCARHHAELDFSAPAALIPQLAGTGLPFGRVVEMDLEFHAALCQLSGHRRLRDTFTGLRSQTGLALAQFGVQAHNPLLVAREHGAVLDAIVRGNEEEAVRLLDEHLRNAQEDLLAVIVGRSM